jgi:hypothetical protein
MTVSAAKEHNETSDANAATDPRMARGNLFPIENTPQSTG